MIDRPRGGAWARHRLQRRVAVLVGFGALLPLLAVSLLAHEALAGLAGALAAEREALAAELAGRLDDALEQELLLLAGVGTAPGFDPADGDAAPERAAAHAAWVATRRLESVSLVDSEGRSLLREPAAAPAPPAAGAVSRATRPFVGGRFEGGAGPRVVLAVPLADWRGRVELWAVGCLDPTGPAWSGLMRLRPERRRLSVELSDAAGARLAALGPAAAAAGTLSARARLEHGGWTLRLAEPEDAALRPVLELRRRLLWLGPLLLALALGFAWGAARGVTQPLAQLAGAARRLADGDIERPVPAVGEDEVGRLGGALEAMRLALRRSFAEARSAHGRLELRVAERTAEISELNRRLAERDRARGRLLSRVIAAQEEERKRIARELHDETCQTLAALALAAGAPRGRGAPDVGCLARRALDGVHAVILGLRPSVLDDLGLFAAIGWLAERLLAPRGVFVRCELEEPRRRLPGRLETALFRVAQEALQNVARHARAESVLVQASAEGGRLRLEIEDDGAGFDPALAARPDAAGRGLGLLGMRERVEELLGGQLRVESAPGAGTRVLVDVPLPAAAAPPAEPGVA